MEFRLETLIRAGGCVGTLEFFQRSYQRFGDVAPAVTAVPAACIRHHGGKRAHDNRFLRAGFAGRAEFAGRIATAGRTAAINARIRAASFFPGRDSTPLHTSIAKGRAAETASAAFSGVNPPARNIWRLRPALFASFQLKLFPVPPRECASKPSSRMDEACLKFPSCETRKESRTRIALITRKLRRMRETISAVSSPCNCP